MTTISNTTSYSAAYCTSTTRPFDAARHLTDAPIDWRQLTALGMSRDDALRVSQALMVRELALNYRHKLLKQGVPCNEAKRIARAIANYDTAQTQPSPGQQTLIQQYCPLICRASLWRPQLL